MSFPQMFGSSLDYSKVEWWAVGTVGRASDLRLIGYRFGSCLSTVVQWLWACYSHLYVCVTKPYNLVPAKAVS